MHRRFIAPIAITLTCLLLLGASESKLHFLSADAVDVVQLLPDPPDNNSDEYHREIEQILKIQVTRSDDEIAHGKSESKLTVFAFADVLGPWFTAENCPQTAEFYKKIASDSKYFTELGKDHWKRPRPPRSDDRVKPLLEEKDDSYPSGHATRGMIFAETLAEIFPHEREALLARGRQIGWDRVIVGVHFPSDVYAGRVLGHALARELLAKPEFRAELEKVKAELDAHAVQSAATR